MNDVILGGIIQDKKTRLTPRSYLVAQEVLTGNVTDILNWISLYKNRKLDCWNLCLGRETWTKVIGFGA